ncbi:TPA: phage tail tape measure protein, partial [Enterobacter roggenkampii]
TNLDLLRTNFNRVADSQEYGGSMQKEYASRAATTENQLVLLKNSVNAISVTLGDTFLPAVNEAAKAVMPYLEQLRTFVRANPELVQSAAKFGAALLGVGVSIGVLSRAIKVLNTVINLSPAKVAIAALAAGAMLIIENWDDVGPVIKEVWQEVDNVAQAMGGWETVLGGVGLYMTGVFTVKTLGTLRTALTLATQLSGVLGKIATLGATTVQIAVAIYMFEQLKEIADAAKEADHTDSFWQSLKNRWNSGGWYNNQQNREMVKQDTVDNFTLSPPLLNQGPVLDRAAAPAAQRSELKVTFDNAPPGMRVLDIPKSGNPLMDVTHDVGYSPFRNK